MVRHHERRASAPRVLAISVIALLAGCSSSASGAPGATAAAPSRAASAAVPSAAPSPSPTTAPTAAPTPSPTPAPSPVALCSENGSTCVLKPGAYLTAPAPDGFAFTVADGWSNDLLDAAGGEIVNGDASIFWLVNPQGGDRFGNTIKVAKTPEAVVSYLQKLKGVTASDPIDVMIGGEPAREIDLKSTVRNNFVLIAGHVGLGLHDTTQARFDVIKRPDGVAVIVSSTDKPNGFDAGLATTQPVVDSVVWP